MLKATLIRLFRLPLSPTGRVARFLRFLTFGVYPPQPIEPGRLVRVYSPFITFKHFEAESRRDYVYAAFSVLRFLFWFYVFHLRLEWAKFRKDERGYFDLAWAGRHDDPSPIWCERCAYSGRRLSAYHGYSGGEACDECPRCGADI